MILGSVFVVIALLALSTFAAVMVEAKDKGGLGEESSKSSAAFAAVFSAGVAVLFIYLALVRFI